MSDTPFPDHLRKRATQQIQAFNRAHEVAFRLFVRQGYGYLSAAAATGPDDRVGRLDYVGETQTWHFVPFHYGKQRYDPNYYGYPGWETLDGTIEGALTAARLHYQHWREDQTERDDPMTQADKDRVATLVRRMRDTEEE